MAENTDHHEVMTVRDFLNAYSRLNFIEKDDFEATHDFADWEKWQKNPVEYLRKRSTEVREKLWSLANGKPRKRSDGSFGADISWDANPWVVAYSLKPTFKNIDEVC